MNNLKFLDLQSFTRGYAADSVQAKTLLSMGLAMVIGFSLPIPSAAMDSPSGHYAVQLQGLTNEAFNTFNENILISADDVQMLTRAIWMLRYQAAFGTLESLLMNRSSGSFIGMVFGNPTYLAKETSEFLDRHADFLASLAIRIKAVMPQVG